MQDEMYIEEDLDPHIPVSGSENRPSDVLSQTGPTATCDASILSVPTFPDFASLPPSVQEALIAYLHGTPMQTAVAYIEDPQYIELFLAACANTLPPHSGVITNAHSGPFQNSANCFGIYAGTAAALQPVPTTPHPQAVSSPSSYGYQSSNDPNSWQPSSSKATPNSSSDGQTDYAPIWNDTLKSSSVGETGYPSPIDMMRKNSSDYQDSPLSDPNTCLLCGAHFTGEYARSNLKRHMKYVHSDSTFPCEDEICERVFKRPDARRAHYKKRHPQLYA